MKLGEITVFYAVLVMACHQREIIFEHDKKVDLVSDVTVGRKLCMKTMESHCKYKFFSLNR